MIYVEKNSHLAFEEVTTNFYEGNLKVCIECMSFDFCDYTFCVDTKGNLFLVDRYELDEAGDMAMSNHSQELFCPVVFSLLDADEKAMLRLGLRTCMNYTAEAMCNEFKPDTQIYNDYKEHHFHLYKLIEKLK